MPEWLQLLAAMSGSFAFLRLFGEHEVKGEV